MINLGIAIVIFCGIKGFADIAIGYVSVCDIILLNKCYGSKNIR